MFGAANENKPKGEHDNAIHDFHKYLSTGDRDYHDHLIKHGYKIGRKASEINKDNAELHLFRTEQKKMGGIKFNRLASGTPKVKTDIDHSKIKLREEDFMEYKLSDLIMYAEEGKPVEMSAVFDELLKNKLKQKIEDRKSQLAFNTFEIVEETEEGLDEANSFGTLKVKAQYHADQYEKLNNKKNGRGQPHISPFDDNAQVNHASGYELDNLHRDIQRYSKVLKIHPDHVKAIRDSIAAHKKAEKDDERKSRLHMKATYAAERLLNRKAADNHPLHAALIKHGFIHHGNHEYSAPEGTTINKITKIAGEHGLSTKGKEKHVPYLSRRDKLRGVEPGKPSFSTHYHSAPIEKPASYEGGQPTAVHHSTLTVHHGDDGKSIEKIRFHVNHEHE